MRDNWTVKRLGEIATIQKGKISEQSEYLKEGFLPIINTDFLRGNIHVWGKISGSVLSEKDDVLILWDGERSGLSAVGHVGVLGSTFSKIKSDNKIDSNYLYRFIDDKFDWIQNQRTGTGVPHVPKDLDKILKIEYPPLPQQRKIAKILSTCDTVIAKTEEAIAKYQAIKQGMMHDLFTRGIDLSTGKLRPKYQDAPQLYKESELGMIPKDWEVKRLEEFGSIHYGKDYKSNPIGRDIPIYGTGGIMGYTSIPLNNGPAVLTGRKGSINNPIYVEGSFWNVDTIFCIKVNDQTNVKWFFSQLSNRDLTKLNEATGVPSVSSTALNRLYFAVPTKGEQDEITNRIESVLIKLKREKASLFKITQIKSGLMQDLLSGKVEVSVSKEEMINS